MGIVTSVIIVKIWKVTIGIPVWKNVEKMPDKTVFVFPLIINSHTA